MLLKNNVTVYVCVCSDKYIAWKESKSEFKGLSSRQSFLISPLLSHTHRPISIRKLNVTRHYRCKIWEGTGGDVSADGNNYFVFITYFFSTLQWIPGKGPCMHDTNKW